VSRFKRHRPDHAERLLRDARRQRLGFPELPSSRLVPSKRGLLTVFLTAAAAGAGVGVLALHLLHVCS
jgi:hypothetical protein